MAPRAVARLASWDTARGQVEAAQQHGELPADPAAHEAAALELNAPRAVEEAEA